jgi:CheY-like chemotaxis protein
MPGMGGEGFLRQLAEMAGARHFQVVFISASTDPGTAILPGVVEVLQKPFGLKELLRVVAAHCR